MADLQIKWNKAALMHVVATDPSIRSKVSEETAKRVQRANSLGAGYRTPKWHDHKTGETKGDTPAHYAGKVRSFKDGPVGIVHTANYAAMKDNYLHNTLAKAVR